jgi:hypothetical protein
METLVMAYGSEKVLQLLRPWEEQARKIDNADRIIRQVQQSPNPSPQLDAEAHKEQLALPDYKEALFKAEDAIRDQVKRELANEEISLQLR